MDIKNEKGTEIFLWYQCQYSCVFCFQTKMRNHTKPTPKENIFALIQEAAESNNKFLIISGWEPTLDPNLIDYLSFAKKKWFQKIIIHTNGYNLADPEYLQLLYQAGLSWIILSIHGFGEIGDIITKKAGNFENQNKALINITRLIFSDNRFTLDTNTVLSKVWVPHVWKLYKYLTYFPIVRRMITYPYSLFWFSLDEKSSIVPDLQESITQIKKILDYTIQVSISNTVIEAMPYCMFEEKYWKYILENHRTHKDIYLPKTQWDFFQSEYYTQSNQHYTGWKIKYDFCKKCRMNENCYWFSDSYDILNIDRNLIKPIYV